MLKRVECGGFVRGESDETVWLSVKNAVAPSAATYLLWVFLDFRWRGGGAFITCSGAVFLGELLSCSVGRWQDSRTTSPNSEFVWIERRVAHGGTLP